MSFTGIYSIVVAQYFYGRVMSSSPEATSETVYEVDVSDVASQASSDVNSCTLLSEKTVTMDKASTKCQDLGLSLVSAPAELKCWNCNNFMTPNH